MKLAKALFWLGLLAVIAGGVYWLAHTRKAGGEDAGDEDQEAPVTVETAKIERKTLAEPETAYGSVVAQPARVRVVSAAFETRVLHVLVAPGQVVRKQDPLVEMEPSSAAQLELRQAMNSAEAAKRDLEQTRSRFDLKLATNQDLGAAEKAANDANLQLASLQQAGLGTASTIPADMDGIVAKVDVQNGQIVPPGGALVETIAADDIEAKLGVEQEDLPVLKEGTKVVITPVQGENLVTGTVRLVTHSTNTDTRLVDVYVSLPPGSGLLLNSYVKGTFNRVAEGALVAPGAAVASDEDGYCVYTVEDRKAVRRAVEPGLEAGDEIELTGTGLLEGQTVVTTGSHELKDGDEVETAVENKDK
jgi:membrane fusion protein (multidrug efflux system)